MDNGLDKILQKIERESNLECEEIMKQAKEEAIKVYKETVDSAIKKKEDLLKKTEAELIVKKSIAEKGYALEKRNSILKAKNTYIDEVINEALEKVRNLNDSEFLALIKYLILEYSVKGDGVLHFNEKDSKRVPLNFIEMINRELNSLNRSVSMGKPANIEDGFVLEYKDIDINCTFASLLSTYEDDIREEVYKELFGG